MPETDNPLNPIWDNPAYDFTRASKVGTLPIRGEKRLIPVEIDMGLTDAGAGAAEAFWNTPGTTYIGRDGQTVDVKNNGYQAPLRPYEAISMAKNTFTDYVTVRIPQRTDEQGGVYTYRFLINPKTVQITRQTMDAHAMSRGGWQLGVWGEDTIDIHLSGTTAGRYFENGLTDSEGDLSLSQRNMVELVNIFENNGYFFEGETANASWNAPGYMRKRIQAQCDVIVSIGNFIWYGMFSSMTVNNSADTPYFNTFEMNFLAWKERYKTTSPWRDSIHNSVTRGHDAIVMASSHGLKGAPYTPNIGIPSSGASASPTASQVVEAAANTFPSPIPSTFNALLGNPTPLFPKL